MNPPCPICGAPRGILKRNHAGEMAETCGQQTCAAKLRAQRLGPAHYRRIQVAAQAGRKAKQRSAEYLKGYNAGRATGERTGYQKRVAEEREGIPPCR